RCGSTGNYVVLRSKMVANHPGFPLDLHRGKPGTIVWRGRGEHTGGGEGGPLTPGGVMAAPAQVHVRRVYENPDPAGGRRVLVDRLWPRGLTRSAAAVAEWLKAVAPSDELRRWYGHQPEKFAAFRQRYEQELRSAERSG